MASRRAAAWAVAAFAVTAGAGGWSRHQDAQAGRTERRTAALLAARSAADRIESQLARSLSATYALAAVIRQNGSLDDFDGLAAEMLPIYGGISNLQLAPGAVVQRIHPLAGNEGALGHDLLRDPARRAEAEAAIASRQLGLAGPFQLRQGGGLGLVGRYPVFHNVTGEERFWGFVNVLIHLTRLLEESHLERLEAEGYAWELSRTVPGESAPSRFAGSSASPAPDPVEVTISVPQARWWLRIAPRVGWVDWRRDAAGWALVLVLATAAGVAAYRLALHPEALRREVAARTAELQEAYRRLEADTEERRRTEEQLREKQKLEAIGQLAGGVAHDFNNLLTGIMGCADTLAAEVPPGSGAAASVRDIQLASARAAELTKQLLGFARRGKFRSVPVNLHELCSEVLRLLGRTVDKRIVLEERLEAGCPVVRGDPGQLQQAILNLAVNARDAMPEGGRMTFSTAEEVVAAGAIPPGVAAAPGRYVTLHVSDTGCGIPRALHERIFEPFFTTKGPGRGTGMGLAMVYGIVRNHGGWVALESQEGTGSRFTLYLPLLDGAIATPVPVARPVAGSGRVLVVDDEPVARTAADRMLRRLGYEAVSVGSGQEAVDYVRLHPGISLLVLLDLSMPGMDGRDTWRALRRLAPELRVVLTSGYGNDGRAQEVLDEGVRAFLPKPYSLEELGRAMAQAAAAGTPAAEA